MCILVRYQLQQKYDCSAVLKPFIDDLRQLADTGVTVEANGKPVTYYGALATVSADNLTAHALAGFSSCFNSGRICRQCMAHYDDIQTKYAESDFVIRTAEVHIFFLAHFISSLHILYLKYDLQVYITDQNFYAKLYSVVHQQNFSKVF